MFNAVSCRHRCARRACFAAMALAGLSAASVMGGTYYVSPSGSDDADGLTPQTAWRSVAKVNATPFTPGSEILFQSGGQWRESLSASSSGTPDAPIVYGAYGSGAKPQFWGSDVVGNLNFVKAAGTN